MIYIATDKENRDALMHYGILGQKWGVRRFQNPDGTLTEAGKKRYLNSDGSYNERYARDRKRNRLGASPEEQRTDRANKYVANVKKTYNPDNAIKVAKENIEYCKDKVRNARYPNEKKAWQLMVEFDKRQLRRYDETNRILSNQSGYTNQEIFEKIQQIESDYWKDRKSTNDQATKLWQDDQFFD